MVQSPGGCGCESILRRRVLWTAPRIGAAKQELCVGVQARVPPVETRPEHIGHQTVVEPAVGIAAEVRYQSNGPVQVVLVISGAAVSVSLVIEVGGVAMKPGVIQSDFCLRGWHFVC